MRVWVCTCVCVCVRDLPVALPLATDLHGVHQEIPDVTEGNVDSHHCLDSTLQSLLLGI